MTIKALTQDLRSLLEADEGDKERQLIAKRYPKNPFVYRSRMSPHTYSIGFKTMAKTTDPLWWTGDDFKDLGRTGGQPEEFDSEAEALTRLKGAVLGFIRKWRDDQAHLIIGWDS